MAICTHKVTLYYFEFNLFPRVVVSKHAPHVVTFLFSMVKIHATNWETVPTILTRIRLQFEHPRFKSNSLWAFVSPSAFPKIPASPIFPNGFVQLRPVILRPLPVTAESRTEFLPPSFRVWDKFCTTFFAFAYHKDKVGTNAQMSRTAVLPRVQLQHPGIRPQHFADEAREVHDEQASEDLV